MGNSVYCIEIVAMKREFKNYALTAIMLFMIQFGYSQSFNYSTSDGNLGTTYSWIDCSSGSEIQDNEWLQDKGLGDKKDDGYAEITWPFNFQFYDSYYFAGDKMYLCTNGFIRFDGIPDDDATDTYNNSISSYSPNLGEIVSLAMEDCGLEDAHSHARYLTQGTAPNRVFTVSLDSLEIRFNAGHYANVQVSFYETSNKVVLKFKDEDVTVSTYMGIHSGNSSYKDQWQDLNGATQNRWREYTPPAKAYSAITITQASTANVYPSNDNEILRVQFDITGGGGSFYLTDLDITAQNTANADVSNVKLYHTAGATFSTDHQVGSSVTISGGKYTFSGLGYDMPGGTSYIWVTYDIPNSATNGNTVDGYIAANDITLNGSTYPSSNANPSGDRTISYFEWTGGTSTNWTVGSNWSTNSVPTSSDNVIIPSAPTNQPHLPTGNNGYCNNLRIESGATLTVENSNKNLRIYGDIDNEGTLDVTGTYNILLFGNDKVIKGSGNFTSARFRLRNSGTHYTLAHNVSCYRFRLDNGTTLDVGDYSLELSHELEGSSGSTINVGTGTISVGTTVAMDNFSPGTGTFFYNGNNSRAILNTTYYSLKVKLNSGTRTLTNVSNNMQNLELTGSGTASLAAAIDIDGNITIGSGCTLDQNGNNINFSGNWTNNGTATLGGSDVVTIDGIGSSHIYGATTFYDLTINKSSGDAYCFGTNHISHTLTLTKGIVNSASNTAVIVDAGATLSGGGTASYVDGPMRKDGNTAFTFPVGDFRRYAPCSISAPSASTQFVAEYHESAYSSTSPFNTPLTKVSLKEYWDLASSASITTNVTLNWRDGSWSGIGNLSDLRMAHWNGSSWDNAGTATTSGSTSSGSITVNGISSFSPFTFGTIDNTTNPLPIELLSFDAQVEGNNVLVSWQTATEHDNDYFIVERSIDGVNAERIGTIKGAGNSNKVLNYDFVDQNPYSGTSYYRLTQVDYNGQSETFDWVAVSVKAKEIASMDIYPNPLTGNALSIDMHNAMGKTQIVIYDLSGRELFNRFEQIDSDYKRIKISLDLPKGVYNVQLISQQSIIIKRLIIN